ncbi:MAG: hypothetical protein AB7P69_05405 [Candidatus Binatia bacterium]
MYLWTDPNNALADKNYHFSFAAVLPEQIAVSQPRPKIDPRISALMLAVLNDAITCIQKGVQADNKRTQMLARQAEEWVESSEDAHPFSFISICTVLGIAPGYVRRGLKQWKRRPSTTALRKVRYSVRPLPRIARAA